MESLSDDELHAMPGPALLERTLHLVAGMNAMAAELARTVRIADGKQAFAADGMATPASWLRGHGRLSMAAASQVVRNGRALEQLPVVAEAHAAGELTADQVPFGLLTTPRLSPFAPRGWGSHISCAWPQSSQSAERCWAW